MRLFKKITATGLLLALFGQGCGGLPPDVVKASAPMELSLWGVIDDVNAYQAVFEDYRKLHPNISVNYRRFRLEEYETELLNALAEDRGPDIFLIHNDWTNKYLPKALSMPLSTKAAYSVLKGSVQKQQTWELRTEPTMLLRTFKSTYADAVLTDVLRRVNVSTVADKSDIQERVMGIPVFLDTLALYYNKDLLNSAGIANPPDTWGQFQEQTRKLTKVDAEGNVMQSGAGIGTASNVERATDILTILMIQNGAQMADQNGRPAFQSLPSELQGVREAPPSYQALEFYTDFANPSKVTYTWNAAQPNSLDAFLRGKAGYFFGYSYHLAQIRARAPKLNLGITKLPQIEGNPVKNIANYWYWAVSRRSKNPDAAWNLLNFLAKAEESKKVLDVVQRPAARKDLLDAQLAGEDVGVFASQVLTAVSWYKGRDPDAKEQALMQMIDQVVAGSATIQDAIRFAAEKINQTVGS